ncbi:MAG: hypothetical protein A2744_02200 [Candidatus Buchananbacteria bacterium RIFCSPHIGHO2_01_FULL_44_11]|uniref:DUF5698 domain-containing protein n=1 Tax=Candidatus Buchananbacteria bacterium RIFCSPHIGHO2_01_FULL_44_11 TaxID=1797535 RepID=A0A1G1Y1M4_9BACT|nr:MAG: hypothetical protein A2744_02200 [Candidatus Buchananbacteria bacterium RIFCSPHIGHO2_01_FULL_44_11]
MKLFKENNENFFVALSEIFFRFFFIVFVILFLLELWQPGFVTTWFNPVWFLLISLVAGIISIIDN